MARYTAADLAGLPLGPEVYQALSRQLGGFTDPRADSVNWAAPSDRMEGESSTILGPNARPNADIMGRLGGYTYDWTPGGYGASGVLSAYDQGGQRVGQFGQRDQSDLRSLGEWGALAGGAFGGLGLAGMGPLSGLSGLSGAGGGVGNALTSAANSGGVFGGLGETIGGAIGGIGDALGGVFGKIGSGGGMGWLDVLGNVGSALLASRGASKAADAQSQASGAAIDEQRRQFDLTRSDLAPYRAAGQFGLDRLIGPQGEMLQPVTSADVMADPGYQFGMSEGQKAIDRKIAASGGRMSGAAIKASGRFGTDYATTGYNAAYQRRQDRLNRLAALAGIGQTATNSSAQAGAGSANAISSLLMNRGDNAGAARMAQGNIWGNALTDLAAQFGRNSPSGTRPGVGVPTSPEGWY